jgi:hypothetical protein
LPSSSSRLPKKTSLADIVCRHRDQCSCFLRPFCNKLHFYDRDDVASNQIMIMMRNKTLCDRDQRASVGVLCGGAERVEDDGGRGLPTGFRRTTHRRVAFNLCAPLAAIVFVSVCRLQQPPAYVVITAVLCRIHRPATGQSVALADFTPRPTCPRYFGAGCRPSGMADRWLHALLLLFAFWNNVHAVRSLLQFLCFHFIS